MNTIVAVLDNIRSVYNVGSIFRTSDALGVQKLYLCGITPTPEHPKMEHMQARDSLDITPDKYGRTPKIDKTALSGLHAVDWEHCDSTAETVKRLKEQGFYIIALELHKGSKLLTKAPQRPLAIVVGHERDGINTDVLELADEIMHIPMKGVGHSMNVATTYGIGAHTILQD